MKMEHKSVSIEPGATGTRRRGRGNIEHYGPPDLKKANPRALASKVEQEKCKPAVEGVR